MNSILIAGGTGLVGSKLVKKLKQKKYNIVFLSTQKNAKHLKDRHYWNPDLGIMPNINLKQFNICINLCGAGIFDKNFTPERKAILINSRINPIAALKAEFEKQQVKTPHFINASAIGYYGNQVINPTDENGANGNDYMASLTHQWESAAHSLSKVTDCLSIFRIGIVLSPDGGFLKPIKQSIQLFAGAVPGSGKQIISWIHIDDLCDAMIHVIENKLNGTFNATSPNPDNLENICKSIAKHLHRPLFLPNIPVWALKLLFGKERHLLLMASQNISPKHLLDTGYKFAFTNADLALKNLLNE